MGKAVPGAEVAVIDGEGREVGDGETGEIAIRRGHPVMFLEYLGKPAATAAKFTGDWLKTGDLGMRDDEGYFTYVARDDDIISSAGYRIGPSEIENCLTGHPDVVMAACVGVPDKVRGEVVKALCRPARWRGLGRAGGRPDPAREGPDQPPCRPALGRAAREPADDGHRQDHAAGIARVNRR